MKARHWNQLLGVIGGVVGTILVGVLTNFLSQPAALLAVAGLTGLGLVIWLLQWLIRRRPPEVIYESVPVHFAAPREFRNLGAVERYARPAYIGFVPLYQQFDDTCTLFRRPAQEVQAAFERALASSQYDELGLGSSNFAPTLRAISAHAPQLQHCWLITTSAADGSGSHLYADVLIRYLEREHGLAASVFHTGPTYDLSLRNEALLYRDTYDLVGRILAEAAGRGLRPDQIIANITTGLRTMMLGMVLACLSAAQDVEFVGAHYDTAGRVIEGDLTPMILPFSPQLPEGGAPHR